MKPALLAFLLFLLASSSLSAQQPAALSKGKKSIDFTVLNGTSAGSIGIWKFRSDRVNRGIDLSFGYSRTHDDYSGIERNAESWSVGLGPAWKRYFKPATHVAPYHRVGLSANYQHSPSGGKFYGVGAGAGIGADWFPTDEVSLGGYTGIYASYSHSDPQLNNASAWSVSFGTTRSGLSMHIYF